jgi:hypothetical protein
LPDGKENDKLHFGMLRSAVIATVCTIQMKPKVENEPEKTDRNRRTFNRNKRILGPGSLVVPELDFFLVCSCS